MKYPRNDYEKFVLSLKGKDFAPTKFERWGELTVMIVVICIALIGVIVYCTGGFNGW